MLQIQRSLAILIERVHGHDSELAVLANENSCRCVIERARRMDDGRSAPDRVSSVTSIAVVRWRRIKPPATRGVKKPATIMVRSPTPRLVAGKSPAETGIHNPLAHGERRPSQACAEGPPAVAVASAGRPSAIRIKIGVAGSVIGSVRILKGRVRRRGNRINATGDPMVEIVVGGKAADTHGIFSSLHGERLTLAELRGFFLVQDGGVARQDVHDCFHRHSC